MKITRKQIYWGLGITTGLVTLGVIIGKNRKKIKKVAGEAAQKAQDWLRPVITKISSPFGYRTNPVTKQSQFHNGIDLPVPIGTKVKSPMDGTVESVYSNKEGGNQVIILHTNGYRTGYAHLSQALAKKGDKIKKGDTVALSGNSGISTGPHVHFTLKDASGNWMDPAKEIYSIA